MRRGKYRLAGGIQRRAVAPFVHQAVVMASQQQQIVDARFTAVGPVADMMRIDRVSRPG